MESHKTRTAFWVAVALAAWMGGCCKTQRAAQPIQPEDPQAAARRGLDKALASLGGDDTGGKLRSKIMAHSASHGGDSLIPGLGESFSQILARSTFREHGFHTSFGVVKEETIGQVAEYLNGPTSPLQGWKGWRYRSGVLFTPGHDQKNDAEAQKRAAAGVAAAPEAATNSRSIVAVVFDDSGVK